MASLYTNCMYNFMQTKLIFRGPAGQIGHGRFSLVKRRGKAD